MRKAASILLLLIFLFNLAGYQLALSFLQSRADEKLELLIDNNEYNDAELTEIRVAMNMPYQQRFTEFERHYGQITVDGKEYNYVKRKVEGDVLVLQCLPNKSKTHLKGIAADITKSNSNNGQGENPVKSSVKIFSFECDGSLHPLAATGQLQNLLLFLPYQDALRSRLPAVPHEPPRTLYC